MRCKICTNNLKFSIAATVGLHKAIKLLDEDATSVEASASFSVCSHTSDTSSKLKFSTSIFRLYRYPYGVITINNHLYSKKLHMRAARFIQLENARNNQRIRDSLN